MKKIILLFAVLVFSFDSVLSQQMTQGNFISVLSPQFVCSGTSTRLPYIFRAQITNLQPNTKYRYYTQICRFTDLGGTNSGAGNPILINGSDFRYTSNPSLTNPAGYDSLYTDASGTYTGWFGFVHTGNTRFTAGNYIMPTITIDSMGSGTVKYRLALNDSILVLGFSTDPSNILGATGIYGISLALPKNIISLYDNISNTGKPLSMVFVESDGIDTVSMPSLVSYYKDSVNGFNGRWGSILPNQLSGGLRRINSYSILTGAILNYNIDTDGIWPSGANTVNPHGSYTSPIRLIMQDAPLIVKSEENIELKEYALKQNYPNPFNPSTTISFILPKIGFVKLSIFDILGREVRILVNETLGSGVYSVNFNGSSLNSGVYFYTINVTSSNGDNFSDTKKLVLVK